MFKLNIGEIQVIEVKTDLLYVRMRTRLHSHAAKSWVPVNRCHYIDTRGELVHVMLILSR
jgi:hypothetical protein